MGSVAVLLVLVVLIAYVIVTIRGRRRGIVAERGIGVGADLGGLADAPRVRVRRVQLTGPDRAEVAFVPEVSAIEEQSGDPAETRYVVWLQRNDFGYELLNQWQRDGELVAIVLPPGGHLIRLRSATSLQHLTLRRLDGDGSP